jgi:hypothetical protein
MTTGFEGHIVAIEADTDYGRHWRTFDATSPVTGPTVARKALEYVTRLSDAGELSDIDCGTGCPCLTPTVGCEGCAAVALPGYAPSCLPCRDAYIAFTGQPTRTRPDGVCECGSPWCDEDHTDRSDALREVFAGE